MGGDLLDVSIKKKGEKLGATARSQGIVFPMLSRRYSGASKNYERKYLKFKNKLHCFCVKGHSILKAEREISSQQCLPVSSNERDLAKETKNIFPGEKMCGKTYGRLFGGACWG